MYMGVGEQGVRMREEGCKRMKLIKRKKRKSCQKERKSERERLEKRTLEGRKNERKRNRGKRN